STSPQAAKTCATPWSPSCRCCRSPITEPNRISSISNAASRPRNPPASYRVGARSSPDTELSMPSAGLSAPAVVYLLADHLDSALAAGEDLLKSTLSWNACDARSNELNEH